MEFANIRKRYWGQHVWARGYIVVTTGTVTLEQIQEYIHKQGLEDHEVEFKITNP
jgi:putative transposase